MGREVERQALGTILLGISFADENTGTFLFLYICFNLNVFRLHARYTRSVKLSFLKCYILFYLNHNIYPTWKRIRFQQRRGSCGAKNVKWWIQLSKSGIILLKSRHHFVVFICAESQLKRLPSYPKQVTRLHYILH